jgi:hypothetical protein
MSGAPDLQHLVQAYGDYDKITLAAWAEYDVAIRQWHADRVARLVDEQYQNNSGAGQTSPYPRKKRAQGEHLERTNRDAPIGSRKQQRPKRNSPVSELRVR